MENNPSSKLLWFAVNVRPQFERSVAAIVRYNDFEEYLPLYRNCGDRSGRVRSLDRSLFPGYVFCRINPDAKLQLQTIPGVQYIVGDGKTPTPVDDAEMAALQATARSGLPAEPWPFSKTGYRVLLNDGPLTGLEGLMVAVRKRCRLVLPVTILNRSVAVEIERDWATPIRVPGSQGTAKPLQGALAEGSR